MKQLLGMFEQIKLLLLKTEKNKTKFKERIACIKELLTITYFQYISHYYYYNLNMYNYLACHCSFKYVTLIDSSP